METFATGETNVAMTELLTKQHRILEKGMMEFRPFGADEQGRKIREAGGVTVCANVEYLEEAVARTRGPEAGIRAVEELCRLLNERIRDTAYHVRPEFLKNQWNSYSYEFVMFLAEFCEVISGDPHFQFKMGQVKLISPIIKTLAIPMTVPQTYKMFTYFTGQYTKGSLIAEQVSVTNSSAVLRLGLTEHSQRQFGPYRRACAKLICDNSKAALSTIPNRVHGLKQPAVIKDITCIAEGDDVCEWEFKWEPKPTGRLWWSFSGVLLGMAVYAYLRLRHPSVALWEALLFALVPLGAVWLVNARRILHREIEEQKQIIQEQLRFVEARYEELREAYLEQEQTTVELKRKVGQLSTLHHAGLVFSSTLDRQVIIETALQAIVKDLQYDRAMISFYDRDRQVSRDFQILGVPAKIADFVKSIEVPVVGSSLEAAVLLEGTPILVTNIQEVLDRLHPLNRQLAEQTNAKSFIAVPLKVKDRIIGSLTVNRLEENSLTQDDLNIMVTVANQMAIALDNANAYRQIESLNVGLEAKVHERTAELEQLNRDLEAANEKLQELDRRKSLFLSHVSHELRTPLTSIKGFVENMLSGLAGSLTDKQETYLNRVKVNADRLIRMITDLLDSEKPKIELYPDEINLPNLATDVLEQLSSLAAAQGQRLDLRCPETDLRIWADRDKVSQILTNLVDNAIKYTPQEGQITVLLSRAGPYDAKVSVIDTGEGISPEYLPRLFERGFRVPHHHKGAAKGSGLGLSIVKHLVELHGGTIKVHSEVGKGSEFVFTLPRRRILEKRTSGYEVAGGKRILVVDDDPDIRQFLMDRLGSYGYVVETANDGREALDTLRKGSYNGLILDIGLPEIDGMEVLHQIREDMPTLPVVMVTASGSKERAVQAVNLGAQAYLLKPFDAEQLKQMVEQCFGPAV